MRPTPDTCPLGKFECGLWTAITPGGRQCTQLAGDFVDDTRQLSRNEMNCVVVKLTTTCLYYTHRTVRVALRVTVLPASFSQTETVQRSQLIAISSDLCTTLTWNLTGSCRQQQRLCGWSRMVVKQFQDGGRPPFWKLIYRHISVNNQPIWMIFCTQQQILNWMNVTWSKMKKLHWTDSEFDRTYFLFMRILRRSNWQFRRPLTLTTPHKNYFYYANFN